MKKFLMLLLALLMLAGCDQNVAPTEDPTTPPTSVDTPTEPTISWVEELGMEWDAEGVLKEMPLTIPDGFHYAAAMEFDGDLLLWSEDSHLQQRYLELCLVELDDGSVVAQRDIPVGGYVYPQCLGDRVYLCDDEGGTIRELDKELNETNAWSIDPVDQTMYMSRKGTLYRFTEDNRLHCHDWATGEGTPLLEGDPYVDWINDSGNILMIRYHLPVNGETAYCALDLMTEETVFAEVDGQIDTVYRRGSSWIHEKYGDQYIYYLYNDDGTSCRITPEQGNLYLLKEDWLLNTTMDTTVVALYNRDGTLKSACRVSERDYGYMGNSLIWNEVHGGYFFIYRSFEESSRLLFWDVSKTIEHGNLPVTEIPQPSEVQRQLEARADELGRKYGVVILVGEQCETVFDEFTATQVTDLDRVSKALNVLDRALSAYPAPFLKQLRYGEVQSIRIHLISDLLADGGGRTGDGYNAFTQTNWDHALMVIDIDDSSEQTYFHEISHLIDRYLAWDAEQRENAVYSEEKWSGLNPSWFDGYTHDYSWERNLWGDGAFIDGYATISPTEDRARVMEYAMSAFNSYTFEKGTVLYKKLDYYARCIRDAFVTDGWADTPLWEQYL